MAVMLLHTDAKPLYWYQLDCLSTHSSDMKEQQSETFPEAFHVIPLHNSYNGFKLLLFTSHINAPISRAAVNILPSCSLISFTLKTTFHLYWKTT